MNSILKSNGFHGKAFDSLPGKNKFPRYISMPSLKRRKPGCPDILPVFRKQKRHKLSQGKAFEKPLKIFILYFVPETGCLSIWEVLFNVQLLRMHLIQ